MTEAEWLAHDEPETMLGYLGKKPGDRKLRLFACACCRRVGHLILDDQCWEAVEIAERFADGVVDMNDLKAALKGAEQGKSLFADASWAAAWTAVPDALMAAEESSLAAALSVAVVAAKPAKARAGAAVCSGAPDDLRQEAWQRFESDLQIASSEEYRQQAILLRDIVGNPFQPRREFGPISSTVVQLAQSLYDGEDCCFALHDALLESGQDELAHHFLEDVHARGCWALDLVMGKE